MVDVQKSRVCITVLTLLCSTIFPSACMRRVASIEQVDQIIRECVPIGSDKQQLNDFLDNLKVDSLKVARSDFHQATRQAVGTRDPEKIAEFGDRIAEFAG